MGRVFPSTWRLEVRSVSRICAHLSIIYVTYTIAERAHMRETERTFGPLIEVVGVETRVK